LKSPRDYTLGEIEAIVSIDCFDIDGSAAACLSCLLEFLYQRDKKLREYQVSEVTKKIAESRQPRARPEKIYFSLDD
jgi:hypothetical protein